VVITDKLASDGAAMCQVLPSVEHRRHKGLNNRAENAHQPTRERERRMRRFKDPGHAQRFLAAYGPIATHFRPRRHRLTAHAYRETRAARFATWRAVTGSPALAGAAPAPGGNTPRRACLPHNRTLLDSARRRATRWCRTFFGVCRLLST